MKNQTLSTKINYDEETNTTKLETTHYDENNNVVGVVKKEFEGNQEERLHKYILDISLANGLTEIMDETRTLHFETLTEKQVNAIEFDKDEDDAV